MYGVGRFSFKKNHGNDEEKVLSNEEQQAKVLSLLVSFLRCLSMLIRSILSENDNLIWLRDLQVLEMKKIIGPLAEKLPKLCDDASLVRYLKARNWNTKKASRMLKDTVKWRLEFKPENILWVCIIYKLIQHII